MNLPQLESNLSHLDILINESSAFQWESLAFYQPNIQKQKES